MFEIRSNPQIKRPKAMLDVFRPMAHLQLHKFKCAHCAVHVCSFLKPGAAVLKILARRAQEVSGHTYTMSVRFKTSSMDVCNLLHSACSRACCASNSAASAASLLSRACTVQRDPFKSCDRGSPAHEAERHLYSCMEGVLLKQSARGPWCIRLGGIIMVYLPRILPSSLQIWQRQLCSLVMQS